MYLSVVIASRLDDYAGDQVKRFETFITYLNLMSVKHWTNIEWELVVVDWNVVSNQKQLKNLECFKKIKKVKHVQVAMSEAEKYSGPNNLNFRLYHALNRGYASAEGRFILSTNSDCFFSEGIFQHIGQRKLKKKTLYLSDRLDSNLFIEGNMNDFYNELRKENCNVSEVGIKYLERPGTIQRRHQKNDLGNFQIAVSYIPLENSQMSQFSPEHEKKRQNVAVWKKSTIRKSLSYVRNGFKIKKSQNIIHEWLCEFRIHTNASGDFILIDRKSLNNVGGYDENDLNMQHMDSDLVIRLLISKVRQAIFLPPAKIYHWVTEGSGGTDPRYVEKRSYQELCEYWLHLFKE
jgi:hypothetical protein